MESKKINIKKFKKLFHLRKDIQGRTVPLIPVLDDSGKFHVWIEKGEDIIEVSGLRSKVINTGSIVPYKGIYFAKKAYSKNDIFFNFINFMHQRRKRKDIPPILFSISNDMHNLAACLQKIEEFHKLRNDKNIDIPSFVNTEIEYIFSVCRSLFDLLQKIAKKTWKGIKLLDNAITKKELPGSFAKMALKGEEIRTDKELQKLYGLTSSWSRFYPQEAPFFKIIRKHRVDIEHYGLIPDYVYSTDKGFAIESTYEPFSSFNVWKKETFLQNNLAPLKPVIAFVIKETFDVMGRFVIMLTKEIKFPEDIAPGYLIFMRGPHIHKLAELKECIENNVWYCDDTND